MFELNEKALDIVSLTRKTNDEVSQENLVLIYLEILNNYQSVYEVIVSKELLKIIPTELQKDYIFAGSNFNNLTEEEIKELKDEEDKGLWNKISKEALFIYPNNFEINGGKIRPDLVLKRNDKKIIFEFDSFLYHSNAIQLSKDKQREREIQALGYPVYRFSNREITENLYFADGVLNQIINIIKKELYENSNN